MKAIVSPAKASFRVLDRQESVHRHMLLEASAGTGKTFAIENIVVRLLMESPGNQEPLLIENILVVTFTRMAARELKERIRSNLEKCLTTLKASEILANNFLPDYLLSIIEQGSKAVREARKRIERALFSFDHAPIFTIHGFCWRMLNSYAIEAGISLDSSSREDQSLTVEQLLQVVRDFLRTGVPEGAYSPQQLKILMKRANNQTEKLQEDLLKQINRGMPIMAFPSFDALLQIFQRQMSLLVAEISCSAKQILEDFHTLAPSYKELRDSAKQIHPDKLKKAYRFASLFDKTSWGAEDFDVLVEDGLIFLEAFDPCLRMSKAKPLSPEALHVPHLLESIRQHLAPVVSQARNEAALFARLASDCQKFLLRYQAEREIFGHNELLVRMKQSLQSVPFADCILSQYGAVLVDEFQDTDPVQWEIFSSLFISEGHSWKGYLHLVGDPKQSIYAFRQADIYTYLLASEKLGQDSTAILDTNFRSRSSLIEALNKFFGSVPDLFSLPRRNTYLPYHAVNAGRESPGGWGTPSLHFWKVCYEGKAKNPVQEIETDFIFPAIAKEIVKLTEEKGIGLNQCAILIADRYQAERICEYLKSRYIPVKNQSGKELTKSFVVDEMRDLLMGILNHHNKSSLHIALAGRLIGLSHRDLELLEDVDACLPFIEKCHQLKVTLLMHGFARFYDELMRSCWHADHATVLEKLLKQKDGMQFYREWQDLVDLIIAEEASKSLLPYGILSFLDQLETLTLNEENRVRAYVDPREEGVAVLTTHMSKGLEFDAVFALGLMNRTGAAEDDLIMREEPQGLMLVAATDENDPAYQRYCEESDAEKMRLLYVALTRAKEHLYVPFVIQEHQKEVKIGCASPIELFLAKMDDAIPPLDYAELYQRIASQDGSAFSKLAAENPSVFTVSILNRQINDLTVKSQHKAKELHPPEKIHLSQISSVLQSFTSLSHVKSMNRLTEESQEDAEERSAPHCFYEEVKTEHSLPSGKETGILLHTILEKLSFDCARNCTTADSLLPLINPFLVHTPFALWQNVVAKIVFNALKTPLDGFCLTDVNPQKVYKETEFLYPYDKADMKVLEAKPGFLKGVIDAFFEHQGKFYLIDWKSNWLGPSQQYYQRPYLEEAMRTHDYEKQAIIYKEACRRYLKLFNNPFEKCFGGIYYVFLRGISPSTGILKY